VQLERDGVRQIEIVAIGQLDMLFFAQGHFFERRGVVQNKRQDFTRNGRAMSSFVAIDEGVPKGFDVASAL